MSTVLQQEVRPLNSSAIDLNVTVQHSSRDLIVGSTENLLLVVWRNATTRDGVAICRECLVRRCAGRGREFALMTIVEPRAQLPDAAARNAMVAIMHEGSAWVQVSALIFEGSGFMAATIRGIVTGISMLARQSFPHRVFENVSDGSRFIEREQSRANQTPFVAWRMEASVAELRRRANEKIMAR